MQVYAALLLELGIDIRGEVAAPVETFDCRRGQHKLRKTLWNDFVCELCDHEEEAQSYEVVHENADIQWGSQLRNRGHERPQARRYYSPFTNLKDYLNRFYGYRNYALCEEWNNGEPCRNSTKHWFRRCSHRHKCLRCEGGHKITACRVSETWERDIMCDFDPDDRQSYFVIRRRLKLAGLSHQYSRIFELMYRHGGHKPSYVKREQIKIDLSSVVYYHMLRKRQDYARYRKKSLGSAMMILDFVLKYNNVPSYYELPQLKCKESFDKTKEFCDDFNENILTQRRHTR